MFFLFYSTCLSHLFTTKCNEILMLFGFPFARVTILRLWKIWTVRWGEKKVREKGKTCCSFYYTYCQKWRKKVGKHPQILNIFQFLNPRIFHQKLIKWHLSVESCLWLNSMFQLTTIGQISLWPCFSTETFIFFMEFNFQQLDVIHKKAALIFVIFLNLAWLVITLHNHLSIIWESILCMK